MAEDSCEMESLVASQYELVRRILEPLSDSDLDSCEKVNKLWANAVKAERNSIYRKEIEMFSWKGTPQQMKVIDFLLPSKHNLTNDNCVFIAKNMIMYVNNSFLKD